MSLIEAVILAGIIASQGLGADGPARRAQIQAARALAQQGDREPR